MKAKPRRFLLAASAICGLLLVSVQPAAAFELFARRLGEGATQKCDACQKGGDACQKGACQKGGCDKGACQKGACQKGGCDKGACQKGACQKGACQKGDCDKGACQKAPHQKLWGVHQKSSTPHQKLWGAHQKGAVQKGGKGKGDVGIYTGNSDVDSGVPAPAPIVMPESA